MTFENDFNLPTATPPVPCAEASSPSNDVPRVDLSKAIEMHGTLIAKRAKISKIFGIGATLLRELHSPKSPNFDPTFPTPFSLTKKGPAYFDVHAVWVWIQARQAIAAKASAAKVR